MVLVMALVRHGIIMGKTNDIAGRELTFSITFKEMPIKKKMFKKYIFLNFKEMPINFFFFN